MLTGSGPALIGAKALACFCGGVLYFAGCRYDILPAALTLSAIANFFYIPHYPFWAILIIALDVWVIWSLTRPAAVRT